MTQKIDIALVAKEDAPCTAGCCTPAPSQRDGGALPLVGAAPPDAAATSIRHETLALTGLDCPDCAQTLERGVGRLAGVINVSASFTTSRMQVAYAPDQLEHDQIVQRVAQLGYGVAAPETPPTAPPAGPLRYTITGMDCADCAANIERQVATLPGVRTATVNFMAATLTLDAADQSSAFADSVQRAIRTAGYDATLLTVGPRATRTRPFWQRHATLMPTIGAAVLWSIAFGLSYLNSAPMLINGLYAAAIGIGGYRIARSGYYALTRGRTLGIDVLMTVAVIGAAAIGEWSEGAAVVVLFALGNLLESLTTDKARNAIRTLMDLSPREATVRTPTGEQRRPVDTLVPGDTVVIKPGERVAADGRVLSGRTTINQAPITGESVPVTKQVGDAVYAGTLNERGSIDVEVTKRAADTTLAKIMQLVEQAQATKAPAERYVDRFARRYTPVVILLAVVVATVPPLFGAAVVPWLYKALVLLVIACPCALVISTPVAIVAGIARASRSGVLIKGGAYLEALSDIAVIAFDKTGTLTYGQPTVTDIIALDALSGTAVLTLAAAVESRSEHPLAGAILRAAQEHGIHWPDVQDFAAEPGRGVHARVDGAMVALGSPPPQAVVAADTQRTIARLREQGKTVLMVSVAELPVGLIAVTDATRTGAADVVQELRTLGVSAVMLTGDNRQTAQTVGQAVGITDVRAELLPHGKTAAIQEFVTAGMRVAMIGDGVNDAPALALATVGIAMGAAGSDTALETADVALMGDDLAKLPYLLQLSRAVMRTIRRNVAFALLVKVVFLALTIAGYANLWLAILADTGAALVVIAHGMWLLRFRDSARPDIEPPGTWLGGSAR